MLKRLAPFLTVLLSVLLDTAVLPVFYYGRFLVPVSLAVVIVCGIRLGRVRGMLYGMAAGLLLDVSAGTLGMKLFPYLLIGFLIGFLLDQQGDLPRTAQRSERVRRIAVRAAWIAALLCVYELVMLIYQYFYSAIFEWGYVRDLLLRVAMLTALSLILDSPLGKLYAVKAGSAGRGRNTREVKRF